MKSNLHTQALQWVMQDASTAQSVSPYLCCQIRDTFQARVDTMTQQLLHTQTEDRAYIISAMVGEIGSNSFDHNLGNWRDLPGIFFAYDFSEKGNYIFLGDRGQGVLTTLQRVRPTLQNDAEALEVAFKEKLSGRAPENRGNGLKFVRQNIQNQGIHLTFFSGKGVTEIKATMVIKIVPEVIHGCLAIIEF